MVPILKVVSVAGDAPARRLPLKIVSRRPGKPGF
jgi:hypothetical protein